MKKWEFPLVQRFPVENVVFATLRTLATEVNAYNVVLGWKKERGSADQKNPELKRRRRGGFVLAVKRHTRVVQRQIRPLERWRKRGVDSEVIGVKCAMATI